MAGTDSDVTMSAPEKYLLCEALGNRLGMIPHSADELHHVLTRTRWNVDRAEAILLVMRSSARYRSRVGCLRNDEKPQAAKPEDEPGLAKEPKHPNYGPALIGGKAVEQHIREYFDEERAAGRVPSVSEVPRTLADLGYPSSPDLERRLAVRKFADMVWLHAKIRLSRAEASLSLAAVLANFLDQFRGPIKAESKKAAQEEKDRRLSLFVTYTGRPDWYSLQHFLEKHDYDLVHSMGEWVRRGIRPRYRPDNSKGDQNGQRMNFDGQPIPLPAEADCVSQLQTDFDWAETPAQFIDADTKAQIDATAFQRTSQGHISFPFIAPFTVKDRNSQLGGVINYDAEIPHTGVPDWTKFRIEHISRGKYTNTLYLNRRTPDEMRRTGDPWELFDWNDARQVSHLGKWARGAQGRVTGTPILLESEIRARGGSVSSGGDG
ncbi:hypothetical protein OHC33_006421 [Knufia fluminis]|uniref:Uncharacterized protein n=1 Tax=Knufia fluminis TaxID=191047 RepID=A0AAN8EUI6_9EURO|nr:hypothetical protein OHC33_006421 [Knufia fluminis]